MNGKMYSSFACLLAAVLLAALVGCSGPAKKSDLFAGGGAVAVWNLEDLSPMPPPIPDLGELLSGAVIEAVESTGSYTPVEREKFLMALEELYLGSSEAADMQTRLRVGEMLGVRYMIFGGYQVVGDDMRLDMRRVDVSTGKVVATVKKEVSASDYNMWVRGAGEAGRELFQ